VLKETDKTTCTSCLKSRREIYPVSDFDQRAANISVDHPKVMENYRSAHEKTTRVGSSEATTDELRAAMTRYRALFEEHMEATSVVRLKAAS
jgi:hypothetical protein